MSKKDNLTRWAYKTYRFLQYSKQNSAAISWPRKMQLLRKGFFPNRDILYELRENTPESYVTDYQENVKAVHINKPLNSLINDKLIFPELIVPYIKMPETFALVENGKLVRYGRSSEVLKNWQDVLDYVTVGRPLVLKPVGGDGGIGIIKVSRESGSQSFLVNQKEMAQEGVLKMFRNLKHYLISEFVTQAEYSNRIYPHSVNTLRLLSMINPDTGEPFIAAAAHRIGNDNSYPVDNCAMGGFTAKVDVGTGRLGKAVSVKMFESQLQWHSVHPDSGKPVEGEHIPHWDFIKKKVLEMAGNLAFVPYLGWDVVVTDDAFTVLEANDGADLKLHQVHDPLLKDSRVRRFYQYHGVI